MENDHARQSQWSHNLVPQMVDRLAQETPDAIYGIWPLSSTSYEAGLRTITYAQLSNIVNGLAGYLVKHLGPGNGDVLTYVGPNDVRLTALVLACIKAGYVSFLTSPRNSPAAHRALLEALECGTLVTTYPAPPSAQTIIEAAEPRQIIIPSVDELLLVNYAHFTYSRAFESGLKDPFMVIHTSGSTGLPKPLIWTGASAAHQHTCNGEDSPEGVLSIDHLLQGKRVMVTVPPFHGAGLCQYMLMAIPFGSIPIVPAAAGIVTAQGLVDALKQSPAEVAILVPSVVAELAQNPTLLDFCASHLDLILYIGGDLPQVMGDLIASKIQLHCWWGASEVGIPHQLIPPNLSVTDWRYIRFHPSVGAVFDRLTEDTYELVIRRDDRLPQTCFSIRGQDQLQEYRTKDLFTAHPTVEDAWCWRARSDDIIVFLNGEKTNPVSMEQHVVANNPELGGALVVGAQRFQAALLIEPTVPKSGPFTTAEQAAFIERIWPTVQEANQMAPAHARVEKALIFVTTPDRPFIRAGKGTIQRGASIAQYTAEIDTLYKNADVYEDDDDPLSKASPDSGDVAAVTSFLRKTVGAVTGWTETDGDSTNFFDRGMDSLQALQLTRALRRGLHRPDLGLPTIYKHPTISQLIQAITTQEDSDGDQDMMVPLLRTYTELIQRIPHSQNGQPGDRLGSVDVILTGSTGTLGTFILRALLDRPGIGQVFCLNRGKDGGQLAQEARFKAAGLATEDLDARVTFIRGDLAKPLLDLDQSQYEALRSRVGLIIHNAWSVNFNLGLSAFRPHLTGLVNLFALSASSDHSPHFVFISSVSTMGGLSPEKGPAPEKILPSMDTPFPNGYARSKFVSELLCNAAARHLETPVTIARVGQVAGAVRRPGGIWNPAEWLPSLVISSVVRLGCLPGSLGGQFLDVDWVPSDVLGEVVLDLSTRDQLDAKELGAHVFNVRNPHTSTWESLYPAIVEEAYNLLGSELELVSPQAWLTRLSESAGEDPADAPAGLNPNPAAKLLDFYREGLWGRSAQEASGRWEPMAVDRTLACSRHLQGMSAIESQNMRKWVKEWVTPFQGRV